MTTAVFCGQLAEMSRTNWGFHRVAGRVGKAGDDRESPLLFVAEARTHIDDFLLLLPSMSNWQPSMHACAHSAIVVWPLDGDWNRGSTKEERLAAHQAIRNSGCLPNEASFSIRVLARSKAWPISKPKRACGIWLTAWKPCRRNTSPRRASLRRTTRFPRDTKTVASVRRCLEQDLLVRKLEASGEQEMADLCSGRPAAVR